MRVDDLRASDGERSVRVTSARGSARLRIGVPAEHAVEGPELTQFAPIALLLAMRREEPLEIDGPVSRRLLDALPSIQEMLSAWSPTFTRVPVRVGAVAPPPAAVASGRACCFSRGVDSMYSASRPRRSDDELTQLVYCDGFDPSYGPASSQARIEAARAAAESIGLPLLVATTNFTELIDHVVDFDDAFGPALAMIGLSLAGGFGRFTIASSRDYGGLVPVGSHPLLDGHWSSDAVAIEHDSVVLDRPGKVRWLVENRPDLLPSLYVCYEQDTAANCGRCAKCIFTAVLLEIADGLERSGSFPHPLDLGLLAETGYPTLVTRLGLNDTYRAIPDEPRFDPLRRSFETMLRLSAELPLDESPHGITRHQTRLYAAIFEGRPYPLKASGPRAPEPEIGPLDPL
jgi:hypothetical protein